MGGDALQTTNNVVYLENVVTEGINRKFGIVGGRAQDGTYVNIRTDWGANSEGNLVVIKNSGIGLINSKNDNEFEKGTNIYGRADSRNP